MHRFQRFITPANLIATIALIVATSSTAFAATIITGANIKDNTLTSADFKWNSITGASLSPAAKAGLVGPKGDTGGKGWAGWQGDTGPKGNTGPVGDPANTRASWASWDPGYLDSQDAGLNSGKNHWYAWSFSNPGCTTPSCHLIGANVGNTINLTGAASGEQILDLNTVSPTPNPASPTPGGPVTTIWQNSTLATWADVTLLYRTENDASALRTRAECWIEINGAKAGPSSFIASSSQREMRTEFLVSNTKVTPGTYNATVRCRDADATLNVTRWTAVRANLTMLANEDV